MLELIPAESASTRRGNLSKGATVEPTSDSTGKKPRRARRWVIGCLGIGCLAPLLLVAGGLFLAKGTLESFLDFEPGELARIREENARKARSKGSRASSSQRWEGHLRSPKSGPRPGPGDLPPWERGTIYFF